MGKKRCAYCKNEFDTKYKRTAEHIFPQALLELYPAEDITFTPEIARNKCRYFYVI